MGTEEIGNRIRSVRREKDLSQQALADRAGVTLATVSRLELGKHDATVTTLRKIAEGLGVSLATLILEEDEQPAPPVVEVVKVDDVLTHIMAVSNAVRNITGEEDLTVDDLVAYLLPGRAALRESEGKEG